MRSSIACARCRRSKIKCVNAGIDTTCRACESSGRDCAYPAPAIGVGASASKRDITALVDGEDRNGDWDSPKRQRSRKSVSSAIKDPSKNALDALDSSILTVRVWEAVFDLFQAHFATLLPFLHPATFLLQIRQQSNPPPSSAITNNSHHDHSDSPPLPPKKELNPLIPLGVLALTARFHPQLVAYHSPSSPGNPSNPLLASEFYATALRSRLAGADSAGAGFAVPDLTRVQALLMLALHEWGMSRGKSAWLYVGMAIRLSQAMGLPFELETELPLMRDEPRSPGFKLDNTKEQTSDDIIAQETKRRTFWACFTLDRCLSSGKYRPRMIRAKKLGIQLPSDNAFAFGERVRTSRLNEPVARRPQGFGAQGVQIPSIRQSLGGLGDDKLPPTNGPDTMAWSPISRRKDSTEEDIDRWEIGAEESVLSRVIRITRIWGSIAKWSCSGGRKTEQYPPWHPESRFAKLRMTLGEFQDSLSRNLQYSPRNTDTHIMYKNTLAPYMVMHVVFFLSVTVLHRANLPFLPLRCNEPVGPSDDSPFAEKSTAPDGFWRESARQLFKAGRHMTDLVLTCQERGMLVENPLVGFAVYNAALLGIYAGHFPQMDPEGLLAPKPGAVPEHQGQMQARKTLDILREMRMRLKMARGWFRTLHRMHNYFAKVKKDMRRQSRSKFDMFADAMESQANGARPARDEEFKLLEKMFFDFGSIDDRLPENNGNTNNAEDDGAITTTSDRVTNISDSGSNAVRSPTGETSMADMSVDGVNGRRDSWVPINNSPGLSLPLPDKERPPSLPIPPGRPIQSQSPYSLPSLQHHHPPDTSLFNTPSPNLPSLGPSGTSGQPSSQQYTSGPNQGHRLQPLGPWPPSRQPAYSHSLPPINATTSHNLPLLPPPGSVNYPTGNTSAAAAASPPMTVDGGDGIPSTLFSTCLGGDDVLTFLEGSDIEQWPATVQCELRSPAGWLHVVWADLR